MTALANCGLEVALICLCRVEVCALCRDDVRIPALGSRGQIRPMLITQILQPHLVSSIDGIQILISKLKLKPAFE